MRRKMTAFHDGGIKWPGSARIADISSPNPARSKPKWADQRLCRPMAIAVARRRSFSRGAKWRRPPAASSTAPSTDGHTCRRISGAASGPSGMNSAWAAVRSMVDRRHSSLGSHSWLGFGVGIQSEPRHTGRPRSHMAGASFATRLLITGPGMRACSTIATGGSPISSSAVAERPAAISRA